MSDKSRVTVVMSNPNVSFCRLMLAQVMPIVRKVTTAKERADAWVYSHGRDHWEFHGPDGFYWHGSADNAADARYRGWSSWWEALKGRPDALAARVEGETQEPGVSNG